MHMQVNTYKLETVDPLANLRLEVVEAVAAVFAFLLAALFAAHFVVDLRELVQEPIELATHRWQCMCLCVLTKSEVSCVVLSRALLLLLVVKEKNTQSSSSRERAALASVGSCSCCSETDHEMGTLHYRTNSNKYENHTPNNMLIKLEQLIGKTHNGDDDEASGTFNDSSSSRATSER